MFVEKAMAGAVGGGVLGLIAAVVMLFQGKTFSESTAMIPAGIIVGVILVFWATKDSDVNGSDRRADPEITKLQDRLRDTLDAAAFYEASGERAKAALRRSDAAVIEAKLRNLGS